MNFSLLIKNALIVDDNNNIQKKDVLVINKKIVKIEDNIMNDNKIKIYDARESLLTPGLIDLHVHFREPGFENKETIQTGSMSAMAGGFTTVVMKPNTKPAIDNLEVINSVHELSKKSPIKILTFSTISKERIGKELVNIKENASSHFVAGFSDDGSGVQDNELMELAFKAISKTKKILSQHCELLEGKQLGVVNEGDLSKRLNVKGIDESIEYKMIERDLKLLKKYPKTKYHAEHISTEASLNLIKEYIDKGLNVSCEVTPHHLVLTEDDFKNNNFKMNPPLRTERDRKALVDGLNKKIIKIIATDHAPHIKDEKEIDIDKAAFGIIGLESCFPVLYTRLVKQGSLELKNLIDCLTINPAKLLGLKNVGEIKIGNTANFALFDLKNKILFEERSILSKSKNSPFLGEELFGMCRTTIYEGKIIYEKN